MTVAVVLLMVVAYLLCGVVWTRELFYFGRYTKLSDIAMMVLVCVFWPVAIIYWRISR